MSTRTRKPPAGLQGDEADLYRLLQPRLITALRSHIRTSDDDVHQDAAAHAWLQLITYQPRRDTALNWLVTVALNHVRKQHLEHPPTAPLTERTADAVTEPVTTDLALEARDALDRLSRVPDRQRHLLTLHVSGHTYDQIAAATGDSYRTIDRQLVRARRQLNARYPRYARRR